MATLTQQELVDDRLIPRLGYVQNIHVFNHLGTPIDATHVKFPYDKWLSTVTPVFRLNGDLASPDSYDGDTGIATIASLQTGDDWTLDGQISYFSNAELLSFYDSAISRLNSAPPKSGFTFENTMYPPHTEDYMTSYAYVLALERILLDLMTWRARFIWTDPMALAGVLQSQIQRNESMLIAIMMNIKGRSYLTPRSVSAGRWQVPGNVNESTWQQYSVIRV
jgi:hypothetical protein